MKLSLLLQPFVLAMMACNLCGQVEVSRFFNAVSNDAVTGSAMLTKTGAGILWLNGFVDIGAYENRLPGGTLMILR